jgi:hypothetical protein
MKWNKLRVMNERGDGNGKKFSCSSIVLVDSRICDDFTSEHEGTFDEG